MGINTVCTNGALTYVAILKNAHSFFYRSLVDQFKWWPISYSQIAWDETLVFGHIQDPIERRHKGILEHIKRNQCERLLEENRQFQNLIRHVCCLDPHSTSIYEHFGTRAWCIDWIPLSDDHEETVALTQKLIGEVSGQRLFPWDYHHAHRSDENKKKLYELVKSLWENPAFPRPGNVLTYLEKDIALFNDIKNKFNPRGSTWKRCSWLREE
jgi:hypothetical protein